MKKVLALAMLMALGWAAPVHAQQDKLKLDAPPAQAAPAPAGGIKGQNIFEVKPDQESTEMIGIAGLHDQAGRTLRWLEGNLGLQSKGG